MTNSRYPSLPLVYEEPDSVPIKSSQNDLASDPDPQKNAESKIVSRRATSGVLPILPLGALLFSATAFLLALSGRTLAIFLQHGDVPAIFLFLSYFTLLVLIARFSLKRLLACLNKYDGEILRREYLKGDEADPEEIKARISSLVEAAKVRSVPLGDPIILWADKALSGVDLQVSETIVSEAVSAGVLAAISKNKWIDLLFVGKSCYRILEATTRFYGVRPSASLFLHALAISLLSSAVNDLDELIEEASKKFLEGLPSIFGATVAIANRMVADFYLNSKLVVAYGIVVADICRPIPFETETFYKLGKSTNAKAMEKALEPMKRVISRLNPFSQAS